MRHLASQEAAVFGENYTVDLPSDGAVWKQRFVRFRVGLRG